MNSSKRRITPRRIIGSIAAAAFAAMILYAFFAHRVKVYAPDGKSVAAELSGGELIRASVRQTIKRDTAGNRIVESDAPAVECPT